MTAPTTLITGAGRGIGFEFVRQCLARGDRVIAATRRPVEALAELAATRGSQLMLATIDVHEERSIAQSRDELGDRVDEINLMINNAGMYSQRSTNWNPAATQLETVTSADLVNVFRVNAVGPVLMVKYYRPLLEAGRARVLNLSSLIGSVSHKTAGGDYAYAASKAALNIMTRALAAELAPAGVVAVAITPGWVRTAMGGSHASLAPEESVRGMLGVASRLTAADAGSFVDYQGEPQPW
jgi:NAD(P)-dependent dehydrogenase (short-subunit alcohol dehydrogenase family)